jgi:lactate dehydrogenase-like 2-hydroxyacid dehydrogenase
MREHRNVLVEAAEEWKDNAEMAGRLILTPHVAWFARSSIEKLRSTVTANVEAWARGEELNLVSE